VPEERVIVAADGQEFDLDGRTLTFIDTPGHANHHGCIFDARSRGFFTGDTFGISYREFDNDRGPLLFAPTTPVAFDPDDWQRSLDRLMRFEPRCMYLTHYSRVDDPASLVDELRRSVREQAELALAEEGRLPDGRLERIRQAVAHHLVERVRRHGCAMEEARIRELLAVDMELNAQGLEVWLVRRARRAARAAG
jgi:glyoxylase-like metal-dependent hydrolase (beta-lactamase superfamily II)